MPRELRVTFGKPWTNAKDFDREFVTRSPLSPTYPPRPVPLGMGAADAAGLAVRIRGRYRQAVTLARGA